jgi:membrane protein DedA with SNARE-associated domain
VEEFFRLLNSIDPVWVYVLIMSVAFVENIFPPSPSDIMIVAAGSLVGMGQLDFLVTLLAATTGSTLGFVVMYKIGDWFGDHIVERGKIKFLPLDSVHKVEKWFTRYGYLIIVINRFLTGTRAVVSFFAGMSELKLVPTSFLCFVSALFWNAILVACGYYLGQNWDRIGFYLNTYSQGVTAVAITAVLLLVARYIYNRRGAGQKSGD